MPSGHLKKISVNKWLTVAFAFCLVDILGYTQLVLRSDSSW